MKRGKGVFAPFQGEGDSEVLVRALAALDRWIALGERLIVLGGKAGLTGDEKPDV